VGRRRIAPAAAIITPAGVGIALGLIMPRGPVSTSQALAAMLV
jgi:hypothetical protein